MGQLLTPDEWAQAIWNYERTAHRLELQPRYDEPGEEAYLQRFLAGDRTPPADDDGWRGWCDRVASAAAEGKHIERVRVFEDPPTDYQRWLRWASGPNIESGEVIRYMTRDGAESIGLLPGAGVGEDWWLLDNARLVVMRFRPGGERYENELVDDPQQVAQARQWWDLAVHHSTPDVPRGAPA